MIGPHFQRPFDNWPQATSSLPDGTVFKSVDDLHILREVKQLNPLFKTVFRKEYTRDQHPSTDANANREKARQFFSTFIDGTFWQQELWRYIDFIEEWNEYLANSQTEQERLMWLNWCEAVNWVWKNEYQSIYPDKIGSARPGGAIRLVNCNTAIGNDIDHRFAQITQNYNAVLGYHNYVHVNNNVIHADNDRWLSGRWRHMDADYKNRGITVQWMFTEGGAYRDVYGGWRHPNVYNGNLSNYINGAIKYGLDTIYSWNSTNGNRALGGVLFSSGNVGWADYQLNTNEWPAVAQFISDYAPPTPPAEDYLPVQPLSQRDPRWASVVLGQPTGHGKTIGNWGCLLVAYNMLAQFWNLTERMPDAENAHYVAMGCFVNQYIQPAALRTAYPNNVQYDGYLNRDSDQMRPKIREWLDAGRPVAARVDFNPLTPQWEQHWVLLIGWFGEDFWMADPWYGDVEVVNNRYAIAGSDVLEAIFYTLLEAPSDEWKQEIWDESVERQPISLNPEASLQAAMFADGFTPVQSEFWYTPSDGVQRACQAGENVATGERRVYYAVVPNWNDVQWFTQ